jgi:hypothetical protein
MPERTRRTHLPRCPGAPGRRPAMAGRISAVAESAPAGYRNIIKSRRAYVVTLIILMMFPSRRPQAVFMRHSPFFLITFPATLITFPWYPVAARFYHTTVAASGDQPSSGHFMRLSSQLAHQVQTGPQSRDPRRRLAVAKPDRHDEAWSPWRHPRSRSHARNARAGTSLGPAGEDPQARLHASAASG